VKVISYRLSVSASGMAHCLKISSQKADDSDQKVEDECNEELRTQNEEQTTMIRDQLSLIGYLLDNL